MAKKTKKKVAKKTAKKTAKKVTKKAAKKAAKKVTKKAAKKVAKKTAKKVAKKTAKKVAKKTAKKVAKKVAKKTAKKVTKKTAKKVAKKAAKKVIKKGAEKVGKRPAKRLETAPDASPPPKEAKPIDLPAGAPTARQKEHPGVDDFIASLTGVQAQIVTALRDAVRQALASSEEQVKWGHPCWVGKTDLCYVMVTGAHITFGFFRGSELNDPKGLFKGSNGNHRHIKLRELSDIPISQVKTWVRESGRLTPEV